MLTLSLYLALTLLAAVGMLAAAGWAARGGKVRRNLVGLLLAVIASYATGFLLDILGAAVTGEVPWPGVVAPAFTWLVIALDAAIGALITRAVPTALTVPFALNAVLALSAVGFRTRHLATGAILSALTLAVYLVARRRGRV